jgi:hypothetical protein
MKPRSSPFITHLARALVPTWRFFDTTGNQAKLEYRLTDGEFKNWVRINFSADSKRSHVENNSFLRLFFNPQHNRRLATLAIIDQTLNELSEIKASQEKSYSQSVSYHLLKKIVSDSIAQNHTAPFQCRFQFRVLLSTHVLSSNQPPQFETVLLSEIHQHE